MPRHLSLETFPGQRSLRWQSGITLGGVVAALFATLAMRVVDPGAIYLFFYASVVFSALYGGLQAGLLTTALSALACAYFFLPPDNSFAVNATGAATLSVFCLIAVSTCLLLASAQAAQQRAEAAHQRLERAHRHLQLTARVTEIMALPLNWKAVLTNAANVVAPHFADWCLITLLDESDQLYDLVVAHPDIAGLRAVRELACAYPPGLHALTELPMVMQTGQIDLGHPLAAADVAAIAQDAAHRERLTALELHSYLCVPLQYYDRTLGAITFLWAESERQNGPAELDWALDFARRCTQVIVNATSMTRPQYAVVVAQTAWAAVRDEISAPVRWRATGEAETTV